MASSSVCGITPTDGAPPAATEHQRIGGYPGPAGRGTITAMEVVIVLDGTEPVRGTARAAGVVVPFIGWLAMTRAIATLIEGDRGTARHDG